MHWTDPGWLATFIGVMIANILSTLAGQRYTYRRIADQISSLQDNLKEIRHDNATLTGRVDMLFMICNGAGEK